MPTLTLHFKDSTIGDFQLSKGKSLSIGRRQENDIVIENLAVSGNHAKIDSVGDDFVLIDLQSKNGSFVNEKLVNSHWLKNGDVISIGKHSLIFYYREDEIQMDESPEEDEKTMIMDTSQYRFMVKKNAPKISQEVSGQNKRKIRGILSYLEGGEGKIKLGGRITKIGKDQTADIVVRGLTVGRIAATITRRSEGYFLSYVSGFSKPKVNEKAVKHSVILNDLDIIDIGSAKLQFFEKEITKKSK